VSSSFYIENFGCRTARADGEAIADRLQEAGLSQRNPSEADLILVNTCSVTAEADRAARAFIRRAHRLNPRARILTTGCYAQRAPSELAMLDGVAAVVGNSHKALAPQVALALLQADRSTSRPGSNMISSASLLTRTGDPQVFVDDAFAHSFLEEAQVVPGPQTRPNLKIQEGCGNRCSFCVIPWTRGSSRSLPGEAVLRQVAGFLARGGNELVLSGINLGRWGRDLDPSPGAPRSLAGLVRRILNQTQLPRLRLSSIEPMDWDAGLISLMAEFGGIRLARHAHLPLQSGADAVLRRMHRRYRPWHYAEKAAALVEAVGPALTLGADVMTGFPGESEAEFEETVAFVRALPFGYLHLFPFSPRPGTRAWTLHQEHAVPREVVAARMGVLRSLAAEKSFTHREQFVGKTLEAITLQTPSALARTDRTAALSENFLPLAVDGQLPANQLIRVRVKSLDEDLVLSATIARRNKELPGAFDLAGSPRRLRPAAPNQCYTQGAFARPLPVRRAPKQGAELHVEEHHRTR
jgi:threonylcarbamoyladenosine tRNA methylthiotransferase MtaB